ncbi:MAG: nitrophenyl compound nitroreductase subunit ArsF family protein [Planctomycetota bacterium]
MENHESKIENLQPAGKPEIRVVGFKFAIRTFLLGFVAVTLLVLVLKNTGAPPGDAAEKPLPHQVLVFYFHGNQRCEACDRVAQFSREAVASFPDAVKAGTLEWREVNRVEPGNEHYVRKFHLVTQSLIVADFHYGKLTAWELLDDALNRQENRAAFVASVQELIRDCLGESGMDKTPKPQQHIGAPAGSAGVPPARAGETPAVH